jgi:hypothetical protein
MAGYALSAADRQQQTAPGSVTLTANVPPEFWQALVDWAEEQRNKQVYEGTATPIDEDN